MLYVFLYNKSITVWCTYNLMLVIHILNICDKGESIELLHIIINISYISFYMYDKDVHSPVLTRSRHLPHNCYQDLGDAVCP